MKLLRNLFLWLALATCAAQPAIAGTDNDARGLGALAGNNVAAAVNAYGGSNLDPAKVPQLVNALLNAENGTLSPTGANNDRYILALFGDSTMAGTRGINDLKSNSWPAKMLPLLQTFGAFDENGFFGSNISTTTATDVQIYDPRITVGAGIVFSTGGNMQTLGGNYFNMANATGALTFAPTKPYDTCDIGLQAASAGGTVGIQFGTGTVQNQVGPVNAFGMYRFTKALGTEPINFTKISGSPGVVAASCFNSAAPKVMVANMAKAGSSSRDWVFDPSGNGNRKPYLTAFAMRPVAVVINLGINDWTVGVPVAEFKSNLQTIITQFKTSSQPVPVILEIPFPSQLSTFPTQAQYVQAIRDLAVSNDCPLLDYGRLFVSWEFSNPFGRYVDARHPTPNPGYQMTAKFVALRFKDLLGL